jgi:chromosome transmission fidelity protein 8
MVHVVIHSYQNSDRKDLVYLDFQGNFDSGDHVKLDNLEIGDLTLKDDSAILIIGHHRLVGKKVKLPKPFAVIHKRKTDLDVMEEEDGVCYDVVTILKEKYVFPNRPGLIVQESLRGLTKIGK